MKCVTKPSRVGKGSFHKTEGGMTEPAPSRVGHLAFVGRRHLADHGSQDEVSSLQVPHVHPLGVRYERAERLPGHNGLKAEHITGRTPSPRTPKRTRRPPHPSKYEFNKELSLRS